MARNDHYWKPNRPLLDGVVFQIIPELNTGLRSVTAGQNDFIYFLVPQQKALVSRASNVDSVVGPTMWSIQMYINYGREPMNNVKVRQALNFAVDREEFNKAVMGGLGEPTQTLMPKAHWAYDAEMAKFYTHDPDRARKLLAEAGHPNGIDLGDYIVVAANALDVQAAQVLQQQWAAAGIKVNLKPMETAPLLSMWLKGEFGILSVALSWSPDPDAIVSRLLSSHPHGKAMGMDDAQLDKMVVDARAILDYGKRAAAYQQIQKHIAEQAYVLQIYQYPPVSYTHLTLPTSDLV